MDPHLLPHTEYDARIAALESRVVVLELKLIDMQHDAAMRHAYLESLAKRSPRGNMLNPQLEASA